MNNKQVMCAVIKVDVNNDYPGASYYAREFLVPYDVNVEEIMESIKAIGKENNLPITRVYLSGHILSLPNSLWTKGKIENYFKTSFNSQKYKEETVSIKR